MVATRGKKIRFEIEASQEQDGDQEVEQVVKPAAKRRRTNKSKAADDDTAFNPSSSSSAKGKGKATATPDQNLLITRRNGRGGKLRDLMNMPVDIFAQVCSSLGPLDIRHLSLTGKRLRDILMTKEARHIWKAALASVPGLPDCPDDLNEPQYVCLLYSAECHTIGCKSRGTKADFYHRVRFCASCHNKNMTNDWTMSHDHAFRAQFRSDTLYAVREHFDSYPVMRLGTSARRRGYKTDERNYYLDALKQKAYEYEALPEAEIPAYLAGLKEKRDYLIKTGTAMIQWTLGQIASRADDIASEKNARFENIKVKLLELGWEEQDFPMDNKEFKDLVLKDQKLTPKIWQNLQPKLEVLLQKDRTERLERRKSQRRDSRERAMREIYWQIGREVLEQSLGNIQLNFSVNHVMFGNPHVSNFLPEYDEILALPSVKPLIEDDTTDTITVEQWIQVGPDVRRVVAKWWRDALKRLVDASESGKDVSPNETEERNEEDISTETETEDALSISIDALKAQLSSPTAAWRCKDRPCNRISWFPHCIKHVLSDHYAYNLEGILNQLRPVQSEARAVVQRLLQDLNLDPETVPSSASFSRDSNQKDYLCTKCDERIARYMTFGELVEHYIDVQRWYDKATEAIRTSPKSCYPSRAVDTELPKIVNDHDWVSCDTSLLRKDGEARKQVVLDLQVAFRKQGLTDPACDTKGIGGADLEKNPLREIVRTCKLCPRDYAPFSCPTRKIELHIRSKHDKEPNLKTDTAMERHYPSNPCPM